MFDEKIKPRHETFPSHVSGRFYGLVCASVRVFVFLKVNVMGQSSNSPSWLDMCTFSDRGCHLMSHHHAMMWCYVKVWCNLEVILVRILTQRHDAEGMPMRRHFFHLSMKSIPDMLCQIVGWPVGEFFSSIFTSNITGKLFRTSLFRSSGSQKPMLWWPILVTLHHPKKFDQGITPQHQFSTHLGGILSYSKEKTRDFRDEIKIP